MDLFFYLYFLFIAFIIGYAFCHFTMLREWTKDVDKRFYRKHYPKLITACRKCGLSSNYWDEFPCRGFK